MALNDLSCAEVPLRDYSLTHSLAPATLPVNVLQWYFDVPGTVEGGRSFHVEEVYGPD